MVTIRAARRVGRPNGLYARQWGRYGRTMIPELDHVDTWIFDLDNTLYPASCDLFALIDEKMGLYIQKMLDCDAHEARRLQKGYFRDHGTTLAGLMAQHGTDPSHFLDFVHDINMDRISSNPALADALQALPGRKLIYTNGDVVYAQRVVDALGLNDSFEAIFDIHASGYIPKPDPRGYVMMCDAMGVSPMTAFFAEDMVRNLEPAKAIGMTTLWVNNGSEQAGAMISESYIDHQTHELTNWLETVLERERI
jgi:putative hydrolase of the HAD superfamily